MIHPPRYSRRPSHDGSDGFSKIIPPRLSSVVNTAPPLARGRANRSVAGETLKLSLARRGAARVGHGPKRRGYRVRRYGDAARIMSARARARNTGRLFPFLSHRGSHTIPRCCVPPPCRTTPCPFGPGARVTAAARAYSRTRGQADRRAKPLPSGKRNKRTNTRRASTALT